MNYTWGEIQILAIQKMFLNNTNVIVSDLPVMKTDKKYAIYLNAMPAVANEGLLRLMDVGKPIIKKYSLNYTLPEDIGDYQSHDVYSITDEDLVVTGGVSHAYYFELNNTATVLIQVLDTEWTTVKTITHTATTPKQYTIYKGVITNTNGDVVRIVFQENGYIYNVRNVALYTAKFRTDAEVYNNTLKQKYSLKTLIPDFFEIISVEYETETNNKYNSDFLLEGDNTLVIDSKLQGNFVITYRAYPTKITSSTISSYPFEWPSEMISLLPLYIASELYKDDDPSLSTQYRNQFEVGLQNITNINEPLEFKSNSGWL